MFDSLCDLAKVKFCRVCGFRVRRVWESYRTFRSFGYEYCMEITEVPGIVTRAYRTHTSSGRVQKTKKAVPVPRVLWHRAYTTHRTSGHGNEKCTEKTEVPGTGTKVLQNFQKFRVLWHGRTEPTAVPGRYKNDVPVPRVL